MRTYSAKASDVRRDWFVIDAENVVLGRLATEVASRLRGKHKAEFTPHVDTGDNIVIINAEKIKVTGKKRDNKMYHRHSGFPGGLKSVPLGQLQAKHPERIIELAVKGMLPKNPLGRAMYRKLKVYAGSAHPHEAQQPQPLSIKEKEYIG
jgi:large subunit ribosomal protein L13